MGAKWDSYSRTRSPHVGASMISPTPLSQIVISVLGAGRRACAGAALRVVTAGPCRPERCWWRRPMETSVRRCRSTAKARLRTRSTARAELVAPAGAPPRPAGGGPRRALPHAPSRGPHAARACLRGSPGPSVDSPEAGRASTHRAPDHLRHLEPRRAPRGGRVRQGLVGIARHARRGPRARGLPVMAAAVGAGAVARP